MWTTQFTLRFFATSTGRRLKYEGDTRLCQIELDDPAEGSEIPCVSYLRI